MDQPHRNQGYPLQLLYSPERIQTEIARLAKEINASYEGRELLVIVVLKGALFFAADLLRLVTVPVRMDLVKLSSYAGTESCGTVRLTKDLEFEVAGKDVLVVEDIVDTGLTLVYLLDLLKQRGAGTLRVCTLIDKTERRQAEVTADFVGFHCQGGFLVGYGLDLDERMRELPAIYQMIQDHDGEI
ncbi:hypoxanthine phosphoribosyltransferase [Geomonas sp. Red32]|uniref:hypoxanthine phosphoribosyltransferase n=1 Tax=Geomonas sp. Red32 TaxID=2912856 RepID=UPI00202CE2A7|nr:hypoxanthine phosphoribosyltransferase [Geomonas sp. Red32]MCM0082212.1 hypoxanthine phosphoribosyltransferase [Geomonas sp. Red32]